MHHTYDNTYESITCAVLNNDNPRLYKTAGRVNYYCRQCVGVAGVL